MKPRSLLRGSSHSTRGNPSRRQVDTVACLDPVGRSGSRRPVNNVAGLMISRMIRTPLMGSWRCCWTLGVASPSLWASFTLQIKRSPGPVGPAANVQ
ncbi:hypothetical protein BDW74DRAFT_150244 [Aspergillus multicolor]|uniref:uncharacterized protein n=1 Tax=Aspergillus multicolor TaxID=41759 RepID=UPI003CCDA1B4